MLNVMYAECHKQAINAERHRAECYYAKCCCAECRGAVSGHNKICHFFYFVAKIVT